MSTSCGWEGKGRYGSFRLQWTCGCAGKTVRSLRTGAIPERFWGDDSLRGAVSSVRSFTFRPLDLYRQLSFVLQSTASARGSQRLTFVFLLKSLDELLGRCQVTRHLCIYIHTHTYRHTVHHHSRCRSQRDDYPVLTDSLTHCNTPQITTVRWLHNCEARKENKKLSWCWQTRATRSKVTQGHRNWHVSICHLWLPINVP